jgi:hypothetical protein
MRRAVKEAYRRLTGKEPEFLFTGWGGRLTGSERDYVEHSRRKATEAGT